VHIKNHLQRLTESYCVWPIGERTCGWYRLYPMDEGRFCQFHL